jgi:hypothetical protein
MLRNIMQITSPDDDSASLPLGLPLILLLVTQGNLDAL